MSTVVKDLGAATAYGYAVEKGYTGTEEEFAELMASYATVGQTAVTAAQTATTKASEAATSAIIATNKASEATTAAQTASTKASEAVGCVETATQKATEATQSASRALGYKNDAESAKAASQTAQGLAESAKDSAISAKNDAVAAKTAAETAQGKAETAQGAAEDAAQSVSASAAQIATNTADITDLKENLNKKANADGSYDTLTAGNAKQLLSNLEQTDMVPYNYRTAGGSLEIGDREKLKKIVGGTVAWNQLCNVTDRNEATASGLTYSFADGVMTVNGTATEQVDLQFNYGFGVPIKNNHVYALMWTGGGSATTYRLMNGTAGAAYSESAIVKILSDYSTNIRLRVYEGTTLTNAKFSSFVVDLTAMFGTTIADYVYSLEQATAGAGVAWLKAHFPKIFDSGYIPYNAGTLEHVSGLSAHKMTGFNQWDEVTELGVINHTTGEDTASTTALRSKNYTDIVGGSVYCFRQSTNSIDFHVHWYDANKNFISYEEVYTGASINYKTVTAPNTARYMRFNLPNSYGTTYKNDICINLHWDGERDGEYEPYEEHSYPLDSDVTLRGIPKLDANNSLYYEGDEYTPDGTVTRKLIVHHISGDSIASGVEESEGTKLWRLNITGFTYGANNQYKKGVVSNLYEMVTSYMAAYDTDKILAFNSSLGAQIIIHDSSVSSVDELKQKLNSTPIDVLYPLATPTTESADPYTEIQNVSNWGTEEFVTTSLVPVGHETAYQPDLRAKIEVAPESPDTDGLYLMKRENGQNSYVAYIGELPTDPTTDGTYTLKATVSSGTVTKTWEADT